MKNCVVFIVSQVNEYAIFNQVPSNAKQTGCLVCLAQNVKGRSISFSKSTILVDSDSILDQQMNGSK